MQSPPTAAANETVLGRSTTFRGQRDTSSHRLHPAALLTTAWIQALGLDAVAVALVWQHAFGLVAHTSPLPAARVGLAMVVSLIYILDRQLDVLRTARHMDVTQRQDGESLSPRHRLHAEHHRLFRCLLACFVIGIAATAPAVRHNTLIAALWLAGVTAAYLAGVQLLPGSFRSGTKELTVGIVFATGCATHTLPRLTVATHDILPGLILAGLLFALNCISISTREATIDAASGTPGLSLSRTAFTGATSLLIGAAWLVRSPLSPAIILSGLLLIALQHLRMRSVHHRLLADAVLLTPLVLWVLPKH